LENTKEKINILKNSKSEDERRQCIPLLKEYLSKSQDDAEAWYDLAGCYDFIGDEVSAEPCYKKTYELGVDKISAEERARFFVGFGSTLRNNLKFGESSQVLKSSLETFPKYPALDIFLAFTIYSDGKYKSASEHLFKAISKIDQKVFDGYERAINWYVENLESHPPHIDPEKIETESLILRPIQNEDLSSIFEYCANPEVSKYTTWEAHKNLEDSKKFVSYAKLNYQRGLSDPLAITLKENPEKLIGTVGWFWNSERYKSIEISYGLSPSFWGKGIVVEASRGLINEALKKNDIHRITSRCIAENKPSERVMKKLGMEYEGTQKQLMSVKGRWVDIKNYCVLAKDWI
jgi:[ribosomal protein S5]-alanine N-acetyltransferase